MRLDRVRATKAVFVDATIFIYHFTGASQECHEFLRRCEVSDLHAVTSVTVLAEVTHRLMMIEAVTKGFVTPGNIAQKLRKSPKTVKSLHIYQEQVETIPLMGIEVLPLDLKTILSAAAVRRNYGLMTNDSLIVGTVQEKGIEQLASADADFAEIEGVTLFGPTDIAL